MAYYHSTVISSSIFIFTEYLPQENLFYTILMFSTLYYHIGCKIHSVLVDNVLLDTAKGNYNEHFDLGIELLIKFYKDKGDNQEFKFRYL